jgi:hypothetical protein
VRFDLPNGPQINNNYRFFLISFGSQFPNNSKRQVLPHHQPINLSSCDFHLDTLFPTRPHNLELYCNYRHQKVCTKRLDLIDRCFIQTSPNYSVSCTRILLRPVRFFFGRICKNIKIRRSVFSYFASYDVQSCERYFM